MGFRADIAHAFNPCLERFKKRRYDLTFLDLNLFPVNIEAGNSSHDYNQSLAPFWEAYPTAQLVVVATVTMVRRAVAAIKAGADSFLTSPVDPAEVRYVLDNIQQVTQMQAELDYLRNVFWKGESQELVRTNSPVMREVIGQLQLVAPTRTTVLLTGETGTGKSLLAKLIHLHSNRTEQQFVSVHCGAIPETLIESELFGHEKGAFTGATQRRLGKFEIASGGTIFLDEVGTLSAAAQIKLLQVLQERTFQRVGGESLVEAAVRVIAATNVDLTSLSERGLFRKDLLYRLSVFPIAVPCLRERPEDLPLLVENFIRRFNKQEGKNVRGVAPAVMNALQHYEWPGNVRELENLIERAFILEQGQVLTASSFPPDIFGNNAKAAQAVQMMDLSLPLAVIQRHGLDEVRRHYLEGQLARHNGRIAETAAAAGITPRQLNKLMHLLSLVKEDFRR